MSFSLPVQQRLNQVLPVVVLVLLAALLWIPFGFNVGFTGDDWYFYLHGRFEPTLIHSGRPFLALPNNIAYWLSPGRFFGFNFMLFLATALRGWLSYAIFRQLGFTRVFAFAVGTLAVLFPADNGAYYMGALAVYYSSVCFLGAFYLLLVYKPYSRLRIIIAIWIFQILSLGMYEASYPLILVSPLILFALEPSTRRHVRKILMYWYLIPTLNLLRVLSIVIFKPEAFNYQSSLMTSTDIGSILQDVFNIYTRHFWEGWLPGSFPVNNAFLPYSIIAGILSFAVCLWLLKQEERKDRLFGKLHLQHGGILLIIVGLCILGLAVAIYLPTTARNDHTRTYYMSVVGAALVIVVLLTPLARRPLFYASIIGILGMLGCLRLLEQGNAYVQHSEEQQQLVLETLALAPNVLPYTGLVILDETPDQQWTRIFHSYVNMQNPFIVAYDVPALFTFACTSTEILANQTNCDLGGSPRAIPAVDQLIFLRYNAEGKLTLVEQLPDRPTYNPYDYINRDLPPSPYIYNMFGEPVPAS